MLYGAKGSYPFGNARCLQRILSSDSCIKLAKMTEYDGPTACKSRAVNRAYQGV